MLASRQITLRLLGLFLLAAVALLLVGRATDADAKVITACVQKQGSTTHRAKAAIRLVRKNAVCLPSERRLTWGAAESSTPTGRARPAGAEAAGAPGGVGPDGLDGSQGPAGPAGIAGEAGARGEAGEAGSPGAEGPAGPLGPIGLPGPQGEPGLPGAAGSQGEPGIEGAAGPIGPQGPEGSPGAPGQPGPEGEPGPQGEAGPQGDSGLQGEPGPQGETGAQGEPGPEGPEGPPGSGGFGGVVVVTAVSEGGEPADAVCPKQARLAIGGGGSGDGKGTALEISAPITEHELSGEGQQPDGWRVKAAAGRYTAYAICTRPGVKETSESEEEMAADEKEPGFDVEK